MIIPSDQLSEAAIANLIAEYCLRDWGLNDCEAPLAARHLQVRQALQRGQLVVLYSQHYETAQLVSVDQLQLSQSQSTDEEY